MLKETDWDTYAECYDALLSLKPYTTMLEEVAQQLLLHNHERILDASCGTGNFVLTLSRFPTTAMRVVGVDRAGAMLNRARKKCETRTNCTFAESDLNNPLPFETDSFSAVVSINTLYAVRNPAFTLSEFYRVLESGGTLLLVVPLRGYENGLILKEHAKSTKSDEYWTNLHESPLREEKLINEAIDDERIRQSLKMVASINREIATTDEFHFFDTEELESIVVDAGFEVLHSSLTYAKQDTLLIARKAN